MGWLYLLYSFKSNNADVFLSFKTKKNEVGIQTECFGREITTWSYIIVNIGYNDYPKVSPDLK